jgi:hypothetical protein
LLAYAAFRKMHVDPMMQGRLRVVFAAVSMAASSACAGFAMAQQPGGELTRKEWRAHIERAQSRLEQLRSEGKVTDGTELHPQQSGANREAREEWLARVEAARKRVEETRTSRETSEQEEVAQKETVPELNTPEGASDDIRVGTLPPASAMRVQPSDAEKAPQGVEKPSSRGEPSKQAGSGREQKPDGRLGKQVRRSQRPPPVGGPRRETSTARAVPVSSTVVATAPSCTSFWGCLKQAVGIR